MERYDLTYATIDSLSEGVGSSQITPLVSRLSKAGLKINLISFEKTRVEEELIDSFKGMGVDWTPQVFGNGGVLGGLLRLNHLRMVISDTNLIHARSDIPAVSGILSNEAPVLWDVRSLWGDQKSLIQNTNTKINSSLYRPLEMLASKRSSAMSTLTNAVVAKLEERNKILPKLRIVVPTAVDLEMYKLDKKMPTQVRALFSGTYNNFYDLSLSSLFIAELRKLVSCEVHWARPVESPISKLDVGEGSVFSASRKEMSTLISNYSFGVSVCKMDAGPSLTASMPTKIGEFLATGRPMVVNAGLGDMDAFIREAKIGVILDGSKENLRKGASELIEIITDPDTPKRCRGIAEKYFNMDVGAEKYLKLYSRIVEV